MSDYEPSIDEIFKIVTIDPERKVKQHIQLRDEQGDEVPIRETIEKLTEYVSDKLKEEKGNTCKQQIMPLMAQSMAGGLCKLMGPYLTGLTLAQSHLRHSLMHMMTVSFYLLKWIQGKKIKIHTIEEQLTDEDYDTLQRVSEASGKAIIAQMAGLDGKEIIKEMLRAGKIKHSDLQYLGMEDHEIDDADSGAN